MSDSNTSLDFSNSENLLQDKVYPVEDRQKKNELFKDFLSDVLSETLRSPEIENIGIPVANAVHFKDLRPRSILILLPIINIGQPVCWQ